MLTAGAVMIPSSVHAIARSIIEFSGPHTVTKTMARLSPLLDREVLDSISASQISTVTDAISFSLRQTGNLLYFGLKHTTSYAFTDLAREGNCIEYAHLFCRVFSAVVSKKALKASTYVVHSANAKVAGQKLAAKGWGDHDWAIVQDNTIAGKPKKYYIDPTLFDAGLGWDIESNVVGDVVLP